MSAQPKTIGSGLSLSNVRNQVDALQEWVETIPAPAMIEVREQVKALLSPATHEVWHLVRIEDADVTEENPTGRTYRITHSTDEAGTAGHPDKDLTTPRAVARHVRNATSITVLVPEPRERAEEGPEETYVPAPHVIDNTRRAELRTIVHNWAVNETEAHLTPGDQAALVNRLMEARS